MSAFSHPSDVTAHTLSNQAIIMYQCRSAFTVLELLVVTGILAIVIAITTPAISHARTSAAINGSLINLREQGVWFAAYATDHRDNLINPFSGRGPNQSVNIPGRSSPTPVPFLPDSYSALYASLSGYDFSDEYNDYETVFFAPLDPYLTELKEADSEGDNFQYGYQMNLVPTSYCYSAAMYQTDQRFKDESGAYMENTIRRRSLSEIRYPAQKVVFHERADFSLGKSIASQPRWFEPDTSPAVAAADGHVERVEINKIYAAIEGGDTSIKPSFSIELRFSHSADRERDPLDLRNNGLFWTTHNGLHGKDLP